MHSQVLKREGNKRAVSNCNNVFCPLFQSIAGRLLKPWLLSETLCNMIGYNNESIQKYKLSRAFVEKIISKIKENIIEENAKRTELPDLQTTQSSEDSHRNKRPKAFFEAMIRDQLDPKSQYSMSHDDLVGEMIAVLGGGYDTTRTTNIIVLILLALHPQIQQQVSV